MPSGCPICDQPLAPGVSLCSSCGFPTALALDALKALAEPEPGASDAPPSPPRAQSPRPSAPDPQEALCDRAARQIDHDLLTLVDLGGDPLVVSSELRQAALSQADGRVVEAVGILRQAQQRLANQVDELLSARLSELEEKERRLRAEGVGVSVSGELEKLREALAGGNLSGALRRLHDLDERLTRLEGDWNGLQSLLRQIQSLQSASESYGTVPPEVGQDVERVKALLRSDELTSQVLDEASQSAARALMLLHEALPGQLEEELNQHATVLRGFPEDHEPSRGARTLHAEATRHLRRGRLVEASERLRELRATIQTLREESQKEAPPVATPDPSPDRALQQLLEKARRLAGRVRTLPPESEVAFEAASEIRRATELLRARKLEEADQTLSRLVRTLAVEQVPREA